nr:hypothetical protein [uncultured bacterium]
MFVRRCFELAKSMFVPAGENYGGRQWLSDTDINAL